MAYDGYLESEIMVYTDDSGVVIVSDPQMLSTLVLLIVVVALV